MVGWVCQAKVELLALVGSAAPSHHLHNMLFDVLFTRSWGLGTYTHD